MSHDFYPISKSNENILLVQFFNLTLRIILNIINIVDMEKCHCAKFAFQKVMEISEETGVDYLEVIASLNLGNTCTACKPDLIAYCESNCRKESLVQR